MKRTVPKVWERVTHFEDAYEIYQTDDALLWQERAATEADRTISNRIRRRRNGRFRIPRILGRNGSNKSASASTGMGLAMMGPTILEMGQRNKKHDAFPNRDWRSKWCQGYSEPGAGSGLAGLQTKAVDGNNFVINGQKFGLLALNANWMFALVRTDPEASKHNGISFVLCLWINQGHV